MNSTITHTNGFASEGTLALDSDASVRFVVYEGGLGNASGMRRRDAGLVEEEEVVPYPDAWHLSARQILVAAIACAALAIAGIAFSFMQSSAHASAVRSAYDSVTLEQVTVHQGDSLLSIASEHSVDGISSDELVALIEEENGLDNATITPGQHLLVPAEG